MFVKIFLKLFKKRDNSNIYYVERYNQIRVEELMETSKIGVILQMNLRSAVGDLPKT